MAYTSVRDKRNIREDMDMRTYDKNSKKLIRVICNCCGGELKLLDDGLIESICSVDTCWGYFSNKDMERHQFDLCESCYDKIVSGFKVSPEITEVKEL